jgi:ATP-dependent Clp protease ATP-binding subunit ClpC
VGHEQGGQLTEAVRRRPFRVLLLDALEKAHRDVLLVLLQLLDAGRLTDGRGRTVDFTNTVVVMTSNLGGALFAEGAGGHIGFGGGTEREVGRDVGPRVLEVAKKAFPPELWNRIEERLVFTPLSREELARVCKLEILRSCDSLAPEKDIRYDADEAVIEYILDNGGYVPEMGARPLRQTIQRLVEAPIAQGIIRGAIAPGERIRITVRGGELDFSHDSTVGAPRERA